MIEKSLSETVRRERAELFESFSNGVTLHGFRFLFDKKNPHRRWIWLLLTTGMFAFSVILFRQIVVDFFGFKMVTSIMNKHELADGIEFPTITICPFSTISRRKLTASLERFNVTSETIKSAEAYGFEATNQSKEGQRFMEQIMSINMTESDIYKLYQLNYTELTTGDIIETFNRQPCQFYTNSCSYNDLKETSAWYGIGKCFQFNYYVEGKASLKPESMSSVDGLWMLMDIQSEDSLANNFDVEGLSITISPYGNPTKTFEGSKYIVIKPGDMAFIKLKVKKSIHEEVHTGSCGTKEFDLIKKPRPYSKALCWVDCVLKLAYDKCGCVEADMATDIREGVRLCGFKDTSCYMEARAAFSEKSNCTKQCPRACKELSYEVEVSTGALGNQETFRKLSELKSWNKTQEEAKHYVRNNMVSFMVSFQDFSVLVEESSPAISWTNLCSSIGGSIGLCLGFSLITSLEFIFFIYDYVMVSWKVKRKSKTDIKPT